MNVGCVKTYPIICESCCLYTTQPNKTKALLFKNCLMI